MNKFLQKYAPAIVVALTLIGGGLRFYNLRGTLQFLGDQGRDALILHRLLIEKDPVFIGPVTSVGNMYLGPGYYYFVLPFFALSYPSPMGPVYMMAFLGTMTITLMYFLGKEMVGERAALFASFLFTFSWTFIENSRFSWNPNPAPIVSLIMVWATYQAWRKNPKYWVLVSVAFSFLIQLHYMTLLSLGSAGVVWLFSVKKYWNSKWRKIFFASTVGSVLFFLISLTPLILFDIRHDFLNAHAFYDIIFGKNDQIRGGSQLLRIIKETHGRSMQILFDTLTTNIRWLNSILVLIVAGVIGKILVASRKTQLYHGKIVIFIWLLIGILGTSVYQSSVFDHYISFLFPVAVLTLGIILDEILQWKFGTIVVVLFLGWGILANVQRYRYQTVGWGIDEIQSLSQKILDTVQPGEKYNVVLLAEHGDIDAMNYRYFLTVSNNPPLIKERFGETDTLFIINEDKKLKKVTDSPVYEIVVFPNKTPSEVWEIPNGPEVTVLRR